MNPCGRDTVSPPPSAPAPTPLGAARFIAPVAACHGMRPSGCPSFGSRFVDGVANRSRSREVITVLSLLMGRSPAIDVNSIGFLSDEEMDRLGRLELLADYMAEKRQVMAEYRGMRPDRPEGAEPTRRRLTNIGTFRAYLLAFPPGPPGVHQDMTLLVRQLAPGTEGVPLEVYCLSKSTEWGVYEAGNANHREE